MCLVSDGADRMTNKVLSQTSIAHKDDDDDDAAHTHTHTCAYICQWSLGCHATSTPRPPTPRSARRRTSKLLTSLCASSKPSFHPCEYWRTFTAKAWYADDYHERTSTFHERILCCV